MKENDSTGFVNITDIVPDAILEPRYYSTYNFIGDRIDGYEEPVLLLTREAAEALAKASELARKKGFRLKLYDAYRPQAAVDHFVRWSRDLTDTRMKSVFYPEEDKALLTERGYIAERSGHSRGSTVDLTLFSEAEGRDEDMGGPFDFFGELSHPDYRGISQKQFENRMLLQSIMLEAGFRGLDTEWWHFTLNQEPYPATYFSFPVRNFKKD